MAVNLGNTITALVVDQVAPPTAGGERKPSVVAAAAAPVSAGGSPLRCRIRAQAGSDVDYASPPVSPCKSPALAVAAAAAAAGAPEFALAPRALFEGAPKAPEREHAAAKEKPRRGVPVYVMLPLDTVRPGGGGVNRRKAMAASMLALKGAGVEGVMVDVWWGVVERDAPGVYDWSGYMELMEMARQAGLRVQAVMSFHQCGGNVGDSVTIPLPQWVVEEMDKDPDIAYTDQWGRRNYEYVSLGCDVLPVLKGRTPTQCYADFMRAFRDHFSEFLGNTIVEIQVGMGPAGELRYPSYPEANGTWKFPGIGAFQCYDKYMLSSLKAAAEAAGKPEWGNSGPTDAGGYNNQPEETDFFRRDGGWNSDYGKFFMTWYSQMLLDHGERILSAATAIFAGVPGVKVSVKVAGIHWHYGTRSHAAELTAGYYNTREHDGYLPIARMLGRHGAIFNFTCLEMRNEEQPSDAHCQPEGLVRQVTGVAQAASVGLAGENALPRYDNTAHDQIIGAATGGDSGDQRMVGFTYLRMGPDLFVEDNWKRFVAFVSRMNDNRPDLSYEEMEQGSAGQAAQPLIFGSAIASNGGGA